MKFIVDEGVDLQIVQRLRQDGHIALYVAEMAPGILDDEVLALAADQNAVLVTTDKDFGELVFRLGKVNCPIMLIRLAGLKPLEKAHLVSSVVARHQQLLASSFSVVSPGSVRFRPRVI